MNRLRSLRTWYSNEITCGRHGIVQWRGNDLIAGVSMIGVGWGLGFDSHLLNCQTIVDLTLHLGPIEWYAHVSRFPTEIANSSGRQPSDRRPVTNQQAATPRRDGLRRIRRRFASGALERADRRPSSPR